MDEVNNRCEESTATLKPDMARIFDQVQEWKETVDGNLKEVREDIEFRWNNLPLKQE